MGLGVDVGVDPQRDRRDFSGGGGHAGDGVELGLALDVEHQDARLQRRQDLLVGLAHPGEDRLARCPPGGLHPDELAAGDHVEPAAMLGQDLEDAQVRVRLDRVADQRINLGKRRLQRLQGLQEHPLAVDVERRPVLLGQLGDRGVLAVELAVAVVEVVHGSLRGLGA